MSMRDWFGKERRKHDTVYVSVTHDLSEPLESLLEQLVEAVKEGGNSSEVINRLDFLTGQVTQLNTRQEMVLNLVEDLATDPEAVKQAAARIKALRQQLQQSIENDPKENS